MQGTELVVAFVMLIIFTLAILAGLGIILLGLRHRAKVIEMMHRERLAMIERGLVPAPETDPRRFYDAYHRPGHGSRRSLSAGIVTVGFGLGLAMVIGFAGGEPAVGAGIGGAIAILGAAVVIMSLVTRGNAAVAPPSQPPALPRSADVAPDITGAGEEER